MADPCRCGLPKADNAQAIQGPLRTDVCYAGHFPISELGCARRQLARFEAFLREHGVRALDALFYSGLVKNDAPYAALSALLRDYGIGGESG